MSVIDVLHRGASVRSGLLASASTPVFALALEPRVMFDGAIAATTADPLSDVLAIDTPDGAAAATQDAAASSDDLVAALVDNAGGVAAPTDGRPGTTEIVFIDSRVADPDTLLSGLPADVEVVRLDAAEDGVLQIADHLAGRSDVDAVHVISHGAEGTVYLGTGTLSGDTLDSYGEALATIGDALSADGDLLLYGCDIGADGAGTDFIERLAEATGADVAASDDATGAAEFNGDWDLEVRTGSVESAVILSEEARSGYGGKLATLQVTTRLDSGDDGTIGADLDADTADGGGLSLREALHWANGFDTITFDSALSGHTITLGGTELKIENSVTIDGDLDDDGAPDITISGNGQSRVFNINDGNNSFHKNVKLDGLILTDGYTNINAAPNGGAIASWETLAIVNSRITDSAAKTNGGGIAHEYGSLYVSNSLISGNRTLASSNAFGGGIYTAGDNIGLANVTIINNSTTGYGGGLYSQATNSTHIFNSTFHSNVNDATEGRGGAMHLTRGGSIFNSTISGNKADNGAAISSANSSMIIDLANSIVLGNTSNNGGETQFAVNTTKGANVLDNSVAVNTPGGGDQHLDGTSLSDLSKVFDSVGSASTTNVLSGVLADTGGFVPTIALKSDANNPALGTGDTNVSVSITESLFRADLNFDGDTTDTLSKITDLDPSSDGSKVDVGAFAVSVPPPPTISSTAVADGTYGIGDTVSVTVTFDAAVTVTGTPQVGINIGGNARTADYTSGSGGTTATFQYTITSSDVSDSNGIDVVANSLTLNGGTITGAARGDDATLTHSAANDSGETVDTVAPTLSAIDLTTASDTGSDTADDLTSDTTPTISFTAESGASVQIDWGNGAGFVAATTASGTGSAQTETLASAYSSNGDKTIQVRLTDAAGNTTTNTLTVTIDTDAPTLSAIDLTTASDTGSDTADDLTSDTTPTISFTAESGASVQIDWGNGAGFVAATTASGTGSAQTETLASAYTSNGDKTIQVRLTDAAGNTTTNTLTVTIDTDAPTLTAIDLTTATDTGSDTADNITSDTTPTIEFTAESGASVAIDWGNGAGFVAATTASGTGSAQTETLASAYTSNGDKTIQVRLTDAAGNTTTNTLTVTIDTDAPTLTAIDLTTATDTGSDTADNITSDTTPTIEFTAESGASVAIDWGNGAGFVAATTASGTGSAQTETLASPYTSDGNKTIQVRLTDAAGNTKTNTLTVTIDTDAPTLTAIDLVMDSDTGSDTADNITSDTTPTISFTAENGASVQIDWDDGRGFVNATTATGTGGLQSETLSPAYAGDGNKQIQVRVTDIAGNVTTKSLDITIDTSAYLGPINLTDGSDSGSDIADGVTNQTTPTIVFSAAGGASVQINWDDGRGFVSATTATGTGGLQWETLSPAYTADGDKQIQVRVTDIAGNVTTKSLDITIDTSAYLSQIDLTDGSDSGSDIADGVTNQTTPTIGFSAESGASVKIDWDDGRGFVDATTASGTGALQSETLSPAYTVDGNKGIQVRVTDTAGNVTTKSLDITIDTAAPSVLSVNLSDSNLLFDETATVTITFSEAVVGFDNSDLTVQNGQLSAVSSADGGITYTATYTPTADLEAAANTIRVVASYTDIAGNTGAAKSSATFDVNTLVPAVSAPTSTFGRPSTDDASEAAQDAGMEAVLGEASQGGAQIAEAGASGNPMSAALDAAQPGNSPLSGVFHRDAVGGGLTPTSEGLRAALSAPTFDHMIGDISSAGRQLDVLRR